MRRFFIAMRTAGFGLILAAAASSAWAQDPAGRGGWRPGSLLESIVSTVVFGLLGIVLAIVGFKLFDAVIHTNLEKEICEKQNLSVAVLCAAVLLGICLIVAAAVL